jgi:ABC-type nickel/cobalt efflux system permease component RcnA
MRLSAPAAPWGRAAAIAGVIALAAFALWAGGGWRALGAFATEAQRALTGELAAAATALRRGEPGALAALLGASALYGVAHAAGPGHGKALVAAAGLGSGASAGRLAAVALAGALGQGATAAAVTLCGLWLLAIPATRLAPQVEAAVAPIGALTLLGLGLWLCWRGLRALARGGAECGCGHEHHHAHGHAHGHGRLGLREGAALAAAIAARPCAGAILVLALSAAVGATWAGLLAVLAMALGTGAVTAAAAMAAVGARGLALGGTALGRAAAALTLAAGLVAATLGLAGLTV